MLKKLFVIALVGVAVLTFSNIGIVSAGPNTKLDLIEDCSAGCPEGYDMVGPTGFGFVNYNQDDTGALRLVVSMKNAEPNVTFTVYITCGVTHATACGYISVGTITTNGQGNGASGAIIVPLSALQSAPLGSGARTDHIDILGSDGSAYVGANLNYTVP